MTHSPWSRNLKNKCGFKMKNTYFTHTYLLLIFYIVLFSLNVSVKVNISIDIEEIYDVTLF